MPWYRAKAAPGRQRARYSSRHALHRQGRTLAIDADPQGSLTAWSAGGELPFTVVSMPTPQIHRQIGDLAADYEHVVIDTPPGEMAITRSAILAVPLVLVPVSPTGLDIDRLRPTWEALADLEPTHPLGLAVGVLLTKIRSGTRSRREARDVLTELDYPVMETEIPLAEWPYAVSFGTSPDEFGAYDDLLAELKREPGEARRAPGEGIRNAALRAAPAEPSAVPPLLQPDTEPGAVPQSAGRARAGFPPRRRPTRITVDLVADLHGFLRGYSQARDVAAADVIRELIRQVRADPELSARVTAELARRQEALAEAMRAARE